MKKSLWSIFRVFLSFCVILKDSTTIKFFSCEKEFFSCVFKGHPFAILIRNRSMMMKQERQKGALATIDRAFYPYSQT